MQADAMWCQWNDSMTTALEAHDALQAAMEKDDSAVRLAAILGWLKAIKVPAAMLNEWRESELTRLELGESYDYMFEITRDYITAVYEILGSPNTLSSRTVQMLADGAAREPITNDAEWLKMIGVKP